MGGRGKREEEERKKRKLVKVFKIKVWNYMCMDY